MYKGIMGSVWKLEKQIQFGEITYFCSAIVNNQLLVLILGQTPPGVVLHHCKETLDLLCIV